MSKKRGLGRGLDALLGSSGANIEQVTNISAEEQTTLQDLPIEKIQRSPYQPRRHFDQEKIQELADSIKAQGVLQPIIVRKIEDNKYELVVGERRWRAAQLAGLTEIPSVIRNIDNQSAAAIALIENIQRENLTPLEEAQGLKRLLEEYQLTHEELGKALGRSRSAVTNSVRLLDLSETVKEFLDTEKIQMGHARALLNLEESLQLYLAQEVYEQGLSVRETEKRAKELQKKEKIEENVENENQKPIEEKDPDIQQLELNLQEKLGTKINIRHQKTGKGKLIIDYSSLDQLEGILEFLQK